MSREIQKLCRLSPPSSIQTVWQPKTPEADPLMPQSVLSQEDSKPTCWNPSITAKREPCSNEKLLKIDLFFFFYYTDCNDVQEYTDDPDWCKPKCTQLKHLQLREKNQCKIIRKSFSSPRSTLTSLITWSFSLITNELIIDK